MSAMTQSFPAPGKLNLMLRIVGRRADGYHLLQTVFRFIDYGDTLTFRTRSDGAINRINTVPGVPLEQDLAVRAARLLQGRAGSRSGADITLEKRLPVGGGLGGGSSDAATTLLALNLLWELNLSRKRLLEFALELGADVPAFVFGENAWAEGVGEELRPVTLPAAWYVVLTPPVAVSTRGVFAHPALKRYSKRVTIQSFSATGPNENDLQAVVCREHPDIGRHLAWLGQFGRAMITGSGACVFAAFGSAGEARAVLGKLPGSMTGFVARGLERHPMHDLVR
jgi:4-diphosphocytidyl-2-C-methyl-D-erythritol kinase